MAAIRITPPEEPSRDIAKETAAKVSCNAYPVHTLKLLVTRVL
jgi:hypothetical protein